MPGLVDDLEPRAEDARVIVAGGRFPRRSDSGPVVMRRGPLALGVPDDQVSSLGRELMRALGNPSPEP